MWMREIWTSKIHWRNSQEGVGEGGYDSETTPILSFHLVKQWFGKLEKKKSNGVRLERLSKQQCDCWSFKNEKNIKTTTYQTTANNNVYTPTPPPREKFLETSLQKSFSSHIVDPKFPTNHRSLIINFFFFKPTNRYTNPMIIPIENPTIHSVSFVGSNNSNSHDRSESQPFLKARNYEILKISHHPYPFHR